MKIVMVQRHIVECQEKPKEGVERWPKKKKKLAQSYGYRTGVT